MGTKPTKEWIDLLDENGERTASLTPLYRDKINKMIVYLTAFKPFTDTQVEALKALGFRGVRSTSPAGHRVLATDAFAGEAVQGQINRRLRFTPDKIQLLRSAYPNLKTGVTMDFETEVNNFDYGSPRLTQSQTTENNIDVETIHAATNDLERIGLNRHGDAVYSANGGARYIEKDGGQLVPVHGNSISSAIDGLLLSGLTAKQRYDALAGVAKEMKTSPGFSEASVQRYLDAIAMEDNPSTPQAAKDALRKLGEEAISQVIRSAPYTSLIGRNLTDYSQLSDVESLYERLPIKFANGMHPIVAAGAYQAITARAPAKESTLLIANDSTDSIVYAGLAMGFKTLRANRTGDSDFVDARLNSDDIITSSIDIDEQAFNSDSSKTIIAAYDYEALVEPKHKHGFTAEYAHELQLINTLTGLTDDGIAVVQLPSINSKRDREFINHLSSMYGIEGVARLDQHGFGFEHPQLLVTISGKRPVQDVSYRFDERFSNYTSPREAFEWLRMKGQSIASLAELEREQSNMLDNIDRDSLSSIANQISSQDSTKIINPLQVAYRPLAMPSNGANQVCVPSSLQRATFIAQAKLMKVLRSKGYEGVIPFLADRLKYEPSFLENSEILAPHQLDQIAHQIILHEDEGRAMIVGSGTGTGKTRIMAAAIRYHLLRDTPVYISGQNDGIFQKLINELYLLDSYDLITPYILNHNVKIFDEHGKEIIRGSNEQNDAIASAKGLPEANLIFATVGQTNRGFPPQGKHESLHEYKERVSRTKIGMIHRFFEDKKPAFILDESHTSGGQSKSYEAGQELIAKSSSQLFLSGTSTPSIHAINLYRTAFPAGMMDTEQLELAVRKGGLPMVEAIITALTEDGAYFRAELPDEKVFTLAQPKEKTIDFNMNSATQLAVFFDYYTSLTGEVRSAITDIVEKENIAQAQNNPNYVELKPSELGFNSSHFGSKVGHMINSSILIHNTVHAADKIEEEIRNGRKVVFSMQHTGRSFLERMIAKKGGSVDGGVVPLPTLRDMCLELLEDIHLIDRREGKKIIQVNLLDKMTPQARQEFEETLNKARDFVKENVAALPFSPIDLIRDELARRDITSTEISSRPFKLVNIDANDHVATMVPRKNNTAQSIKDFHDGKADVIIMTAAGSTGHDMHARKDTPDNREVTMIMGEIDNWAVNVLQTAGRVDRMNQVGKPRYFVLDPGLPAVTRMMENAIKKIAFVSSATTGNAKNNMLKSPHDGEACILSDAGMKAVIQYLTFNPELANRLYMDDEIAPYAADTDATITYNSQVNISNKFLSRLMMLPPEDALDAIEDVAREADMILREQRALGIDNSGGVRFLDIKGTITQKTVVQASPIPDNSDHPLLGDVVAYSVSYKETTTPMSSEDVAALIEVGVERMQTDKYYEGQGIQKAVEAINDNYHKMMFNTLPDGARSRVIQLGNTPDLIEEEVFKILEQKTKDGRGNMVAYMHDALNWIKDNMPRMTPGGVISYTPRESLHSVDGVIVGMRHPRPGQEHNMSQWSLEVAVPGESQPVNVSLMDIYRSRGDGGTFDIELFSDTHMIVVDFDEQVATSKDRTLNVLAGNLPRAAIMLQNKSGVMSINFTDDQGNVRRGFQLPSKMTLKDLRALEQPMPSTDVAAEYLRSNPSHTLSSHPTPRNNEHIVIRRDRGDASSYTLEVPRNQARGGIYHSNKRAYPDPITNSTAYMTALEHITGETWSGTRQFKHISIPDHKLEDVLEHLETILNPKNDEHLYGGSFSNEWLNKYFQKQKDEAGKLSALSAGSSIKSTSEGGGLNNDADNHAITDTEDDYAAQAAGNMR